jgi:hypothetical protein
MTLVAVPMKRVVSRHRGTSGLLGLAAVCGLVLSCIGSPRVGGVPEPTASPAAATTGTPTPTTAPVSAATPATVDGLHVYTVSELLEARAAGTVEGGPIALRGFWTERSIMHSCSAPTKPPGELELRCHDGEWGITERDESIGELTVDFRFVPASGPHLTPFIEEALWARLGQSEVINGQRPRPVPILVIGHLDDPRAKECQPETKRVCVDRFVVDRIVDYRSEAVPTPGVTPSPTPFPFGSPPPAPFELAECAGDGPYSFVGWITGTELKLDQYVPTTAYAAITRDVIEIGEWIDDPDGSGHQFRTMGRRICFAAEWDQGSITYAAVPGTAYRDWDDGHHTPLGN